MSNDDGLGMLWWNRMSEHERAYWCRVADSARPVDAWRAYQRAADQDQQAAANPAAAWERIGGLDA